MLVGGDKGKDGKKGKKGGGEGPVGTAYSARLHKPNLVDCNTQDRVSPQRKGQWTLVFLRKIVKIATTGWVGKDL